MDSYYVPLNENQIEKIKKELNVSDEVKFEHSVKLFEEWVSYQTYLPQHYDRVLLRTYLRQCKHDLEKAKTKFRNYLINITKLSNLFDNRLDCLQPNQAISRYMYMFPLPETTPEGYRVIFTRIINPDPNVMDLQRIMQTITLYADYRMHIDEISSGDIFVTDAELLHGGHMPVLLNNTMKKSIEIALESYPIRIKAIHIVATMPLAIHGINIFKAFLKEDLREKIHIHKNMQSVMKHIPIKCFPSDCGGGQKCLNDLNAEITKVLQGASDIFDNVQSLKLLGPVPKDVDTNSSLEFGIQGSFRKLNVD
nr:alpha-tocopherol transfer protein-like [Onthophagus taurus]